MEVLEAIGEGERAMRNWFADHEEKKAKQTRPKDQQMIVRCDSLLSLMLWPETKKCMGEKYRSLVML